MKITIDNNVRRYDNMSYKATIRNKDTGIAAAERDRDHVIIDSSASRIKEKQIMAEAAGSVICEVRTPTSQEKIENLKRQVAEGTYQPDAERIAACILLEGGIT